MRRIDPNPIDRSLYELAEAPPPSALERVLAAVRQELEPIVGTRRRHRLPRRLMIALVNDRRITFLTSDKQSRIFGEIDFDGPLDEDERRVIGEVKQAGLPVFARLSTDLGLVTVETMPPAALPDLDAIVANRLDVLTPWTEADAYFDALPLRTRTPDGDEVVIAAAARETVDDVVMRIAELGLPVVGIDVQDGEPDMRPELNLRHDQQNRTSLKLPLIVFGCCMLLTFAFAGYLFGQVHVAREDVEARAAYADGLSERISDMGTLSARVETLQDEVLFVSRVRKDQPSTLIALEALSRLLPDNVWLRRVDITGDALEIGGFARDASLLPQLLEASGHFSQTEFSAPSTRVQFDDGETSNIVERFALTSRISVRREVDL